MMLRLATLLKDTKASLIPKLLQRKLQQQQPPPEQQVPVPSFSAVEWAKSDEVLAALKRAKPTTSAGVDGVPMKQLQGVGQLVEQ